MGAVVGVGKVDWSWLVLDEAATSDDVGASAIRTTSLPINKIRQICQSSDSAWADSGVFLNTGRQRSLTFDDS